VEGKAKAAKAKPPAPHPADEAARKVAKGEIPPGLLAALAPHVLNGQVGSLLKINKSGDWQENVRSSFKVSVDESSIVVNTISVPTLIRDHEITRIDFLKIDTQGTDLQILKSFLEGCDIRVAVVEIEVTANADDSHYVESKNSMSKFFELVNLHGFKVVRMMPASADCTEYNVFIAKTYSDYAQVDAHLDFKSLRIFSRFWTVLGIGNQMGPGQKDLHLSLLKKLLGSFRHPGSSYKSLVIKLTS
jgi:FkbM family methyltransferase